MKEQRQAPIGNRDDREAMKKMAGEAAAARDAKFAEESKKFMREKMAEHGLLDSFGNLKPEAHKPLSEVPLVRTDDERVKP